MYVYVYVYAYIWVKALMMYVLDFGIRFGALH